MQTWTAGRSRRLPILSSREHCCSVVSEEGHSTGRNWIPSRRACILPDSNRRAPCFAIMSAPRLSLDCSIVLPSLLLKSRMDT